ncbi:hypothetical protein HK102_007583, partial [Quaeritorhiza haematococci]
MVFEQRQTGEFDDEDMSLAFPDFDSLEEYLRTFLHNFEQAQHKILLDLYAQQVALLRANSNSLPFPNTGASAPEDGNGGPAGTTAGPGVDDDDLFLVFYFAQSLLELGKELLRLMEVVVDLKEETVRRRGMGLAVWLWSGVFERFARK